MSSLLALLSCPTLMGKPPSHSLGDVKEAGFQMIRNTDWQCLVTCFSSNYKIMDTNQRFNPDLLNWKKKNPCLLSSSASRQAPRKIPIYLFWGMSWASVFFILSFLHDSKMHPGLKTECSIIELSALSYSKATILANKNQQKNAKRLYLS